ncbi:hypothetical protein HOY80DRAFT_1040462 [Tuber brumale]|nr:hypothetical protein HOY80DRAFT_1040462 [Tuber brumale]
MSSQMSTLLGTTPTVAAQYALQVVMTNPDSLREQLDTWTIILADPETPEAEVGMICARVEFIGRGLRDALEQEEREKGSTEERIGVLLLRRGIELQIMLD